MAETIPDKLTILLQVISATGALGIAAFGLVDASKVLWGGVSRFGRPHLFRGLKPYEGALDAALAPGEWKTLVDAQWINGRALPEQKAVVRTLIRLGLGPDSSRGVAAVSGVDEASLTAAVARMRSGTLTKKDLDVLGRVDACVEARMDAAFARADHQYRNIARVAAAGVAVVLALAAVLVLNDGSPTASDWGFGLLVGVLAVPIAPVAKDLASSLSAAARAVKSARTSAVT